MSRAKTPQDPPADEHEDDDWELLRDLDRRNAFQLMIGGIPHSHVDLDDPTHLEYEYVRQIAHMVDLAAQERAPLRVLHLGGGGLTLPRYIAVTRPGSGQQVVEIDGGLLDFVRRELPLPRNARVRLRCGDARDLLSRVPEGAFDMTVTDVYAAARIPDISPPPSTSACRSGRCGRPACTPRTWPTATAPAWPSPGARSPTPVSISRTWPCSPTPASCAAASSATSSCWPRTPRCRSGLVRRAASDPFPCRVVRGTELAAFQGGAKPVSDAEAKQSPAPPADAF